MKRPTSPHIRSFYARMEQTKHFVKWEDEKDLARWMFITSMGVYVAVWATLLIVVNQ